MSTHQERLSSRPGGFDRLEDRALMSAGFASRATRTHGGVVAEVAHRAVNSRAQAAVVANIVYDTSHGQPERLDLYEPVGTPPPGGWPTLVAIHGGGWRKFDKVPYGAEVASQFNPAGYVVVAINYALSTPTTPSWPTNFEDAQAAVRWARDHAGTFGIDPNRIAAIGESAGGHLAELLGTDPAGPGGPVIGDVSSRVQAVVSFYGPTDLAALVAEGAQGAPAAEQFLGGPPDRLPSSYADASPIRHVTPEAAPMLLIHGTADTVVPLDQATSMASALSAEGVPNRLIAVEGAAHGFEFLPRGRELLPQILAFLDASWH